MSLRTFILRGLILCGLLCAISRTAEAQQQEDHAATEQRLRDLREQIELDRRRLSQASKEEQTSLATLRNLEREIALREELTRNYQRRLRQLTHRNDSIRASMSDLEVQIDDLKSEYRRRALHAYKYGRLHDLALILSAQSINQMLIRVSYLRRFTAQRRERLDLIKSAGATLKDQRQELSVSRSRNEQMLAEARQEERNLEILQREKRAVVGDLRAQRTTLAKSLEKRQEEVRKLEARISELIAAESSRRRSREASDPAATAAYIKLSGSFLQNKGRLPWPSSGAVTEPFGNNKHPVYGTITPNPGLLIATRPGAEVRAVFDGEIMAVDAMPGYGTLVTLSHGDYKSVYGNFSSLYVSRGEAVRAGQVIGRAGTDKEPKGSGIFFAIFKSGQPIDPSLWLASP